MARLTKFYPSNLSIDADDKNSKQARKIIEEFIRQYTEYENWEDYLEVKSKSAAFAGSSTWTDAHLIAVAHLGAILANSAYKKGKKEA